MLMTRSADGRFTSRPMSTQEYEGGETLWLATDATSRKAAEIRHDPNVNLAFYNDDTCEWVSVCGLARLVRDTRRVAHLYAPSWKLWLPTLDATRSGEPDDPRITLIEVQIEQVNYFKRARGAKSSWVHIARTFAASPFGTGVDPRVRPSS
jgi:general stress protein 26